MHDGMAITLLSLCCGALFVSLVKSCRPLRRRSYLLPSKNDIHTMAMATMAISLPASTCIHLGGRQATPHVGSDALERPAKRRPGERIEMETIIALRKMIMGNVRRVLDELHKQVKARRAGWLPASAEVRIGLLCVRWLLPFQPSFVVITLASPLHG